MKWRLLLSFIVASGLAACTQESKPQEEPTPIVDEVPEKQVYENEVFNEVTLEEVEGKTVVTGKARVFEGVFQYAVVSGNEVLLENYYQTDGAPAWGEFTITLDKALTEKAGSQLELFVYSAKDGAKINILTIPLN
ncbi:Gmad2 immunoglobulin-like domain-containing protein [Bacillus sp. MRMR6]|uniref:Gmad2 immunoglobulin-like domain-containing protein n=1 Tax=Bacillus sp. MRMR6 TaxID=1928617 RepID=UPI00095229DD|nr:Gmad2 immunoglobulin-like domain-containing protein [Bacillus sp. MRMR6]OLS37320.1 hypothetical protein BTR25_16305 [Bacillus sp. MRMR6]